MISEKNNKDNDWEEKFLSLVQELDGLLVSRGFWTGDKNSRDGARLIHAFGIAFDKLQNDRK